MTHELKCWPEYFQAIVNGLKTYELRKDDRNYTVGDRIKLREWNPETSEYLPRIWLGHITHVLRNAEQFGLREGYCVLGII